MLTQHEVDFEAASVVTQGKAASQKLPLESQCLFCSYWWGFWQCLAGGDFMP